MKIFSAFGLGLCLLLVFSGTALATSQMPSAPSSAVFYPNEIYLTVEERLTPESLPGKGRGLVVVLPGSASQSSFSVTVNDQPVNSFYWLENIDEPAPLPFNPAPPSDDASTPSQEGIAERRALLGAMASLQGEIDKTSASLKVVNARIELWENIQPDRKELSPDDLLKLDGSLADLLPALHEAKSRDTRLLRELQSRMEEKEAALSALDQKQTRHFAVIPFDGPDGKAALVRYSYLMPGACSTAYRVTAYPAKEALSIVQDAFLFQPSGQVWKDVDVYISTTRRDTAIRPQTLAPWRINFGAKGTHEEKPMRAETNLFQMSQNSKELMGLDMTTPAQPVQEEKGTFRLWSLGKRTIDSDVSVSLPLASDEYKASYYYTLQPSVNPKGFLTAELSLDKSLELPAGTARFFVDDVAVGEQPMSLNGNKATLFFGTDPQVTASMRDLKRSTGESGFISKEQNELWHWEIVVRNTRSRAVDVRIEDPMPDAQDAAIKVSVESTPKPEESTTAQQLGAVKVYLWKYTLQPGETQTIEHKVQIHAPADKDLAPGRYR